jgi:hypothetical protein
MNTPVAKVPLFESFRRFFGHKPPDIPDYPHAEFYGDCGGTGLTHVNKDPYKVANCDERGNVIDHAYIESKLGGFPKSSALSAGDLDPLLLAYGKNEADRLLRQASDPVSGHAANLIAIASWEKGDLESLLNNQERNLASLKEAYDKHERIRSAWI